MKRRMPFILILSLTLLLNGCWSKRELNELAIVVALGVDKIDDEFEVSVQVVDPSEVSSRQPSGGRTPIVTYHAKGASVFEAIRRMTTVTARKLYFSHIQTMIIGEELATEGISDTLDLLARDQEFRNDFHIIVSDETSAKEVLGILTPLEKIPANKMYSSNEVSEKFWASTSTTHLDKLISDLNTKENTVITTIRINGNPKLGSEKSNVEKADTPAKLQYAGFAVFKQDKLIGLLTEDESKGYNYLNDNVKSTIEVISCPNGGKLSTELISAKTKVKGNVKNGMPSIDVSIEVNQNVGEVECNIDLTKLETIELVNNETSKLIKENIQNTLGTIQKQYKVDVLGFGEAIHRANFKEWKKIKNDWVELYPDLKVNVSVNVHTRGLGTMQNSIFYNVKE